MPSRSNDIMQMVGLLSKCFPPLLMISGIMISCSPAVVSDVSVKEPEADPKIIFVSLKIFKDSTGVESIELINKTWAMGKLKESNENTKVPAGKLLLCEFLDKNSIVLSSVILQNPLTSSMEQYSPDGHIKRVEAKLHTSYFTIRSEVSSKVANLRISSDKGIVMGTFDLL